MTFVQIIIIFLALFALLRTVFSFKKKLIGYKLFIFWFILWIILIILVVLPQSINPLLIILGAKRGVDVAVYFSILLIFYLIYKIAIRLEKIEHEITEIVRYYSFEKKDRDKHY